MALRARRPPLGVELGGLWGKKRDIGSVAARLLSLSSVCLTSFLGTLSLTWAAQAQWPGSPLFWGLGKLAQLIVAAFVLVCGVLVLLVTGRTEFLKVVGTLITEGGWGDVLCPLFCTLLTTALLTRTFRIARISKKTQWVTAAVLFALCLIWGSNGLFDVLGSWLGAVDWLLQEF